MTDSRIFAGREYLDALRRHYPEFGKGVKDLFGFVGGWTSKGDQLANESIGRFQRPEEHGFKSRLNAWSVSTQGDVRWIAARRTYKGLILGKTPFDLLLYTNLIWELQPRTIIEFGALQGGSGLWLADQMQTVGTGGEVHSFELLTECIHPRAAHPRLFFHAADLNDLSTLDRQMLSALPHPWLVIDDAHVNVDAVLRFMSPLMVAGDYYVLEDIYVDADRKTAKNAVELINSCGFKVDVKYTDAFGMNATQSPNAWLRKD